MQALKDIQQAFRAGILDDVGVTEVTEGFFAATPVPGEEAFNVYRNNVRQTLKSALADNFPATEALLGEAFFAQIAEQFLVAYPPRTPILASYGGAFADFLCEAPELETLPYAGDVARLEWHRIRAYTAEDAETLNASALADFDTEALASARLNLTPCSRFVYSGYEVDEIWRYCTYLRAHPDEEPPTPSIDPVDGGISLIIFRTPSGIEMDRLDPAACTFLMALDMNEPITRAFAAAEQRVPGFDLGATLGRFLARGVFSSIELTE